ncbi:MAG: glutathionylspermidine synthase [Actinobacteria bacterium 13_2_20CM_2_71_6]|nr:MAG: glutathionylspermidine synthase [Actinobacteria bacterium 13_2_20CM_2_71_6]
MQRISSAPRASWRDIVREQAQVYAGADVPEALAHWDESACYVLELPEVLRLEAATDELHRMCLAAARHAVMNARYQDFGIPEWAAPALRRSLAAGEPSLYGCLDLWYDGKSPPKLLEYHADCPPALVETAICQWYWQEQTRPDQDQWNRLHERLVAGWHTIADQLSEKSVHCGWSDLDTVGTDRVTIGYLAETAQQAGLSVHLVPMRKIGWDGGRFVDDRDEPITTCFKLYPWAWMVGEPYGRLALAETTRVNWLEPAWKLLLSSPALYALLWELYPGHPNLLPAYLDGPRELAEYDALPLPGTGGYCYRRSAALPVFEGQRVALSCWVVADTDGRGRAAGVGFRESIGPTMAGYARFVPHIVTR